jgi:hypothetical protein
MIVGYASLSSRIGDNVKNKKGRRFCGLLLSIIMNTILLRHRRLLLSSV